MPSSFRSFRAVAALFAAVALAWSVPLVDAQVPAPTGTLAPGVNPDDAVGELILPDTPLDGVLVQLEQLTGRIVLRPNGLPQAQIALRAKDLTRAEAVFALETVLSLNGIGLVPVETKFLKVVPIQNVRSEAPELHVGPLDGVPASGKVVSKLFRLQYIDTATFQAQVGQFINPAFGNITAFPNSNAVIVTDTMANLQRLESIIGEVDRQVAVETKFYQINYAKPSELAQQIRTMLDSARSSFQGAGGQRGAVQGQPAPGQPVPQGPQPVVDAAAASGIGGASLQSVLTSNTSITPDDRTYQIIVITNPANLPFFDNLIAKLDVAADPLTSIEVIPMNYAKADELASLLSDFISGRSGSGTRRGENNRTRERQPMFQRTDPFNQQNREPPNPEAQVQAVENAVNAATGEGSSQFSDLVTINADERTNSIIVAGTTGDIALIKRVVSQLDVVLAQVRIDVLIAEVTLTKNNPTGLSAFGIDYDSVTNELTLSPITAFGLGGDSDNPISITGELVGGRLIDYSYSALIEATQTNSNVNLLSAPNILTTHNQPANIVIGQAVPIVSSTINATGGVGGVTPIQNVNYEEVALTLDVTPIIGPNDVVQLEIKQAVNDIVGSSEFGDITQPIIGRREASSFVSVRNKEIIVIGGLQRNSVTKGKSRIPIVGQIPLIGELFSSSTNNRQRQELLIFLRPVVLRNTDEANANAQNSVQDLPLTEENAKIVQEITGAKNKNLPQEEPDQREPSRRRGRPGEQY